MKNFLLIPLIAITLSVSAQERPVDELFRVMSMDNQVAGGFEAMMPMIDQMAEKFKLDNEGKEDLKGIFRAWFNEDVDRAGIMNEMKSLYAKSFTEDEIRAITKFYQTPVGQKFLAQSVQLMQVGAKIGMQEAQLKQVKLMERIKPFLEKHNIK